MGPEFLFYALVMPLARRLGDRWLDAVAQQIDDGLRRRLRRLISAARVAADDQPDQLAQAQKDVVNYIKEDATAAVELAEIAQQTVVAMPRGVDRRADRLAQYRAFLLFVFDRVAALGRPVALPGFLNTELCVVVIDTRVHGTLADPLVDEPDPDITLALGNNPVSFALELGLPRVWIVRSDDAGQRDALVASLNAHFGLPHDQVADPMYMGRKIKELLSAHTVELVGTVLADRVEVWRPRPQSGDILTDLKVMVDEAANPDPRLSDPFYTIASSIDGIRELRGYLERLLEEQWDTDERFRQALIVDAA